MSKRRWLQILVAVALVAGISLSTVWVSQASTENQAQSRVSAARAATHASLAHAAQIGLLPSDTASLRQAVARLDAARPPSSLPFWRRDVTQFYQRQRVAYLRLSAAIVRTEAKVTEQTRADARAALAKLDATVTQAKGLDVDVASAVAVQQREGAALGAAPGTPAHFRAIVGQVNPAISRLARVVVSRQAYVTSVVSAAHGDVNNVWAKADDERTVADHQAWLIGLVSTRGAGYTAALDRTTAAVHTQQDARGAAVKEAALHDLVATVGADFAKTVPSKLILISTEDQTAQMFQNGTQVYSTPVTTGGPELPTDHGVFHIYMKVSPFIFHSPWPEGSPYYYPPTPVQYWMPFYEAEGLHDASWRSNFGPGSNLQPTDLGTGQTILGTHGCVNLPTDAAAFVWDWAPVGTTVVVV